MDREIDALLLLHQNGHDEERPIVKSAIFRPDRPGFIYIELAQGAPRQQAIDVAARVSMDMLIPSRSMRFIPCPDAIELLNSEGRRSWAPGTWARIRGPKLYRGDIGFIFSRKNKTTGERSKWVAVVPRIDIHQTKSTHTRRPIAQTLNITDLASQFHTQFEYSRDFFFRGFTFNYSGYLLLRLEEADLYPAGSVPLSPLLEELDLFLRLPVLAKGKWDAHRLSAWQQGSRSHDRVKIITGQHAGVVGVLLTKHNQEAEVYVPALDGTVVVGVQNLQIHLQHGDYVRVVNGENTGKVGYITGIDGEWVDVTEPQQDTQVRISIKWSSLRD